MKVEMKKQLLDYITNNWSRFGLEHEPVKIDFLVKNKYRKLTFFFFEKNQGNPFALAKCTPFPRSRNEILGEYKILCLINSKAKGRLKNTIPKPISIVRVKGIPVLFQNFLPGKAMSSDINCLFKAKRLNKNFKMANDWLIAFNNCFDKKAINPKIRESVIDSINRTIRFDNFLSKADFKWVFTKIKLLKETSFTPKHTDFWPGNILVDGSEIRVLDWEDFGLSNLPLFDLFHFMVSYFLILNLYFAKNQYEKFYRFFFTKTNYTKHIVRSVSDYCNTLNINPEFLDLFFVLYLVEFYNLRCEQEGKDYEVTIRSNRFIKIFLRHKNNFILSNIK